MPPKIDPHIASLPATIPFVAPERTEREVGRNFIARIGANEGNFGCSPHAVEAMAVAAQHDVRNYGDPDGYDLRKALGAHLNLPMKNIALGAGIDGLLGLIVRIFSSPGDSILTSLGAYPTFNYHVVGYDRKLHTVPYNQNYEDLMGLAEAANNLRPAIVYISNPDNPMGTWHSKLDIVNFINSIPDNTLIVLDEAYGETAPEGTLPDIDVQRHNLLRVRTFSKAYGLAGLRCGYAFGHENLITPFDKIRDHFGMNVMAQKAALAAFKDQVWLTENVRTIAYSRQRIFDIAKQHGLEPIISATNFVAIDCGRDGAYAAQILQGLMTRRIFVRKPMAPVLDRCIRVSTGRPEEIAAFDVALAETLDALK